MEPTKRATSQPLQSSPLRARLCGDRAAQSGLTPPALHSVFDPRLIVLRGVSGAPVKLESAYPLAEALRSAIMVASPQQPPPDWISGHAPDGRPLDCPHLALLSLADVGHSRATGQLLGMALAIPAAVDPGQLAVLRALLFERTPGALRRVTLRTRGIKWELELCERAERGSALDGEIWTGGTRGATVWATVSPIVFDKHPKQKRVADAPPPARAQAEAEYWEQVERMIGKACERVGLPRPAKVTATPESACAGAPAAGQVPRLARKNGSLRRQTHAVLRFDTPVAGPILLGAGRYRGYGACRPLNIGSERE